MNDLVVGAIIVLVGLPLLGIFWKTFSDLPLTLWFRRHGNNEKPSGAMFIFNFLFNTAMSLGLAVLGHAFLPGWWPYVIDVLAAISVIQTFIGMVTIYRVRRPGS